MGGDDCGLGSAGLVLGACVQCLCDALFAARHHVTSGGRVGRGGGADPQRESGAAALAYEVLAGRLADFFLFAKG
jgi:hypothetical protein